MTMDTSEEQRDYHFSTVIFQFKCFPMKEGKGGGENPFQNNQKSF